MCYYCPYSKNTVLVSFHCLSLSLTTSAVTPCSVHSFIISFVARHALFAPVTSVTFFLTFIDVNNATTFMFLFVSLYYILNFTCKMNVAISNTTHENAPNVSFVLQFLPCILLPFLCIFSSLEFLICVFLFSILFVYLLSFFVWLFSNVIANFYGLDWIGLDSHVDVFYLVHGDRRNILSIRLVVTYPYNIYHSYFQLLHHSLLDSGSLHWFLLILWIAPCSHSFGQCIQNLRVASEMEQLGPIHNITHDSLLELKFKNSSNNTLHAHD